MNSVLKSFPVETLAHHETFRNGLEELAWMYDTEFSPDYMIE